MAVWERSQWAKRQRTGTSPINDSHKTPPKKTGSKTKMFTFPPNEKEKRDSLGFLELLADWAGRISLPQQFYSLFTTFAFYQNTFMFFITNLRVAIWIFWRKQIATFWAVKRVGLSWNRRNLHLSFLSQLVHYYHEIHYGLFHDICLNATIVKKTILVFWTRVCIDVTFSLVSKGGWIH